MMGSDPYYDIEPERYEFDEAPRYRFTLSRRAFVQSVGAGILITPFLKFGFSGEAAAQDRTPAGRLHIAEDGVVTVFSGKVEIGQGSRTQIGQAAAEELGVPLTQVRVVLADTALVPDDGGTFGSRTTPSTIPSVRQAAAACREALMELACEAWNLPRDGAAVRDGEIHHTAGRRMTLAELVANVSNMDHALAERSGDRAALRPPEAWTILGQSVEKLNARGIVTGAHRYPSDVQRPEMLYGAILRPPAYNTSLVNVDTSAVESMEGVVVVRDNEFVGVAAPTSRQARTAIKALAARAAWNTQPHPSSDTLYTYLKEHTSAGSGRSRSRDQVVGDVDAAIAQAETVLRASYGIPYVQHAPMETRSAVAEWDGDALTVWTGTTRPFDVRNELARTFGVAQDKVRLIMPDSGGGFGGKHTGEAAIEAARLARSANRPVSLQWSREEEFTWAYFRPAGVIDVTAALDSGGRVTAWEFTNFNSGGAGLGSPYRFPNQRVRFQACTSPLREGSYRTLAATANNFAREACIDRLASAAQADPVVFRLEYLDDERLKNVLQACADRIGWADRRTQRAAGSGVGIACGTEKGSFVATAAEVTVDTNAKTYVVRRICTVFECGAVHHPRNLQSQVEGCVIMGLGAVLREAIRFEDGKVLNPQFSDYTVPRFKDLPDMETYILDRPDLASAGGSETPIIAIAPAIANAIYHATGKSPEALPIAIA